MTSRKVSAAIETLVQLMDERLELFWEEVDLNKRKSKLDRAIGDQQKKVDNRFKLLMGDYAEG